MKAEQYLGLWVWPAIISFPLLLTVGDLYKYIFPSDAYDAEPKQYLHIRYSNDTYYEHEWPSPLGLTLGILAVVIGQIFTLLYFFSWNAGSFGALVPVEKNGPPLYSLMEGLKTHLAQPEGFLMLGGYLIITWMFGFMPSSYYSFSGGINWFHVAAQLLIQDFVQYGMHLMEHNLDKRLYRMSHKPHHRFTNPKLFDAFNGSPGDTFLMILIPLIITARLVPANVWSYMTFGSLYANWLCLIHSEYKHSWDAVFALLGLGTAADHHVHHKLFVYNFGHLFMYWDVLLGTYKNPNLVALFNPDPPLLSK